MNYIFRIANNTDIEKVFSIFKERVNWMDRKGIRQWNVTDYLNAYPISYYEQQQKDGNLYILSLRDGRIIGTIVLLEHDDRWHDCAESSAHYIHNLATVPSIQGAGSILLQEAEKLAIKSGKEYIRLDCSIENLFLNQYYETRGYKMVGHCQEGLYLGNRREKKLR